MAKLPNPLVNYFFCDTETTGITSESQVLTLYCCITNYLFDKIGELEILISYDSYNIQPKALEVNGIDIIQHHNNPESISLTAAKVKLENFIFNKSTISGKKLCFAGHATPFDISFLKKDFVSNFNSKFLKHTLDTGVIATLFKQVGLLPDDFEISLENLVKFYNVETKSLHNAKHDVEATIAVLKCMIANLK